MLTMSAFPFLMLPQEIQDKIMGIHFSVPEKITPVIIPTTCLRFYKRLFPAVGQFDEDYQDRNFLGICSRPQLPHSRLQMLLVCREFNSKYSHMFYLLNKFAFSGAATLTAFLLAIGPQRRRHLRSIEIRYWHRRDALEGFALLAECDSLEDFILHVAKQVLEKASNPDPQQSLYRFHSDDCLKVLRGLRGLKTWDIGSDLGIEDGKQLREWLGEGWRRGRVNGTSLVM
jgi:hypothetical protein